MKLPRGPLFPLAYGAEAWARVSGKEPFLTADALRMSRYRMYFSSAKAGAELGYRARPPIEALRDALGWFASNGDLAVSFAGPRSILAAAGAGRTGPAAASGALAFGGGGGAGARRG